MSKAHDSLSYGVRDRNGDLGEPPHIAQPEFLRCHPLAEAPEEFAVQIDNQIDAHSVLCSGPACFGDPTVVTPRSATPMSGRSIVSIRMTDPHHPLAE